MQSYSWAEMGVPPTLKLKKKVVMEEGTYTELMVRGTDIKTGDFVVFQTNTPAGRAQKMWDVVAVQTEDGMGWKYDGGGVEVRAESRWTYERWFKVKRPKPQENEFGPVTP